VGFALPNGAAGAIDRYLDAVDAAVPGLIVGLHVTGSLALGDYRPERSDIDVVAVVDCAPDAAQRSLLAEVHRVVATRVDGPYLTAAALGKEPVDVGQVPYHVDGRFEYDVCHEVSAITWAILAEHAITVRGDAPTALGVRADPDAVQAFSTANLAGYWAGWARTIAALLDGAVDDDTMEARLLEWGVLGAARVHCAAATGAVISKLDSGSYARDAFDAEWQPVIDLATSSRRGEIEEVHVGDLRRACVFVRSLSDSVAT
jgi:nucleotidyltransferase-like protein/aminoglycoside adenylyltransferase-like protein